MLHQKEGEERDTCWGHVGGDGEELDLGRNHAKIGPPLASRVPLETEYEAEIVSVGSVYSVVINEIPAPVDDRRSLEYFDSLRGMFSYWTNSMCRRTYLDMVRGMPMNQVHTAFIDGSDCVNGNVGPGHPLKTSGSLTCARMFGTISEVASSSSSPSGKIRRPCQDYRLP